MPFSLKFSKDFFTFKRNILVAQNYGWEPDPFDQRDEDHEFGTTQADKNYSSSVSEIDRSNLYKAISAQLHLPSCTANAGADYLEAVDVLDRVRSKTKNGMDEKQAIGEALAEVPHYSRLFLWWNGRNEMDPPRHKDIDSGCYNRLIMDIASRFGVCREKLWPYDENVLPPNNEPRPIVRPSLSAYRDARGHMTSSYHAILDHGDVRLEKIVKAIQATPGVMFGTGIGPSFGDCEDKVIHKPQYTNGRHAMVIVGYDRNKSAFKVRNSWGKDFGVNGYCWMHEDYIAWRGTNSFWVCTKGVLS